MSSCCTVQWAVVLGRWAGVGVLASAVVLLLFAVRGSWNSLRMQGCFYLLLVLHVAEGECTILSLTVDTPVYNILLFKAYFKVNSLIG